MTPAANDPLTELLTRQRVVILDGGLATELEARGHDLDDELWSARLLLEEPEAIRRVHLAYLEAGADCIVTSTYQATVAGLGRKGLTRREAEETLRLSVRLALEARSEFWRDRSNRQGRIRPLVAASVGPYGAYLADGSEYSGAYDVDRAGLVEFHRERLELLASSGADLLACETIPSRTEAVALREVLATVPGVPAWMSFSCRDAECLWDGSDLAAVGAEAAASPRVLAVGVNCTAPRHLDGLIASLAAVTAKPIVAYPNSGESYDAASRDWVPATAATGATDGAEGVDLVTAAPRWRDLGARLIGGCCRVSPGDIRRLRVQLLG